MISLPAILELPDLRVKTSTLDRTERGVVKVLRKIRPDWPREDIILEGLGERNTYAGYAGDREDAVVVRVNQEEAGDKVGAVGHWREGDAMKFSRLSSI